MNIIILDDYQDAVRKLRCAAGATQATPGTGNIAQVEAMPSRSIA